MYRTVSPHSIITRLAWTTSDGSYRKPEKEHYSTQEPQQTPEDLGLY